MNAQLQYRIEQFFYRKAFAGGDINHLFFHCIR